MEDEIKVDISKLENKLRKPMIIGMVRTLLALSYNDFVSVLNYLNFLSRDNGNTVLVSKEQK